MDKIKIVSAKDLIAIDNYICAALTKFDTSLLSDKCQAQKLDHKITTDYELEVRLGAITHSVSDQEDVAQKRRFSSGLLASVFAADTPDHTSIGLKINSFLQQLEQLNTLPSVTAHSEWTYTIETVERPVRSSTCSIDKANSKVRIVKSADTSIPWHIKPANFGECNLSLFADYLEVVEYELQRSRLTMSDKSAFIKLNGKAAQLNDQMSACEKHLLHNTNAICLQSDAALDIGDLKIQLYYERKEMLLNLPVRTFRKVVDRVETSMSKLRPPTAATATVRSTKSPKQQRVSAIKQRKTSARRQTDDDSMDADVVAEDAQPNSFFTKQQLLVLPKIVVPIASLIARKSEYRFKLRKSWIITERIKKVDDAGILRPMWRIDVTFTWHYKLAALTQTQCLQRIYDFCINYQSIAHKENAWLQLDLVVEEVKRRVLSLESSCHQNRSSSTGVWWPNVEFELECIDPVYHFLRNGSKMRNAIGTMIGLVASLLSPSSLLNAGQVEAMFKLMPIV